MPRRLPAMGSWVGILLLMLVQLANGQQEPRSWSTIPTAHIDSRKNIDDIVRQAKDIVDPSDRLRALASALYYLGPLPSPQGHSLHELLVASAKEADDHTRISTRGSIVAYAPEAAMQIARLIGEQRWREIYLGQLVGRWAKDEPERARQLLDEIKHPEARYLALIACAAAETTTWEQAASLLAEASATDIRESAHVGPRSYAFANALLRFAKERPEEVADFVEKRLSVDEAILAAVHMSWQLARHFDAPQAAERVVRRAVGWIPKASKPDESTMAVIRFCHQQLGPADALKIFDHDVLPTIDRGQQNSDSRLSVLAPIGMDALVARARTVAEGLNKPLSEVLPGAAAWAAHENAGIVMDWLNEQPPGALRAACTNQVAGMLRYSASDRRFSDVEAHRWLATLCEFALEIEDPTTRWLAVDSVLSFAEAARLPSGKLVDEWRSLWQAHPALRPDPLPYYHVHRLPSDEQERRIAQRFERDGKSYWKHEELSPWSTLRLISHSSLSKENKTEHFEGMALETETPTALAAIAHELAPYDYSKALKSAWRSLPKERRAEKLYLDTYPPFVQPSNAKSALDCLREGRKAYLERKQAAAVATALWLHADAVPESDRSDVLGELASVLLEAGERERALAVARLVSEPSRRIVLLAEVAANPRPPSKP